MDGAAGVDAGIEGEEGSAGHAVGAGRGGGLLEGSDLVDRGHWHACERMQHATERSGHSAAKGIDARHCSVRIVLGRGLLLRLRLGKCRGHHLVGVGGRPEARQRARRAGGARGRWRRSLSTEMSSSLSFAIRPTSRASDKGTGNKLSASSAADPPEGRGTEEEEGRRRSRRPQSRRAQEASTRLWPWGLAVRRGQVAGQVAGGGGPSPSAAAAPSLR